MLSEFFSSFKDNDIMIVINSFLISYTYKKVEIDFFEYQHINNIKR